MPTSSCLLRLLPLALALLTPTLRADVARDWTVRNPTPLGEDIHAIVDYTNNAPLWVAVGGRGTLLTSADDGVTWTPRFSSTTADLRAVVWTGNRYVVVGDRSTVLTSTDGLSWTATQALGSESLRNIVYYQNALIIAVGGTGTVPSVQTARETSLSTWVKGSCAVAEAIVSAELMLDGKLIAATGKSVLTGTVAAGTGAVSFVKPAGVTGLTATDLPMSVSVASDGRHVLATANATGGGGKLWHRPPSSGQPWTLGTATTVPLNIRRTNSEILGAGAAGAFYQSSDGITWTNLSGGSDDFFTPSQHGSNYLAGGRAGRLAHRATSATAWTSSGSTGSTATLNTVAVTSAGAFAAAGDGFTFTSANGTSWAETPQAGLNLRTCVHDGANFIFAGDAIHSSPTGAALTLDQAAVVGRTWRKLAVTSTHVVALGSIAGTIVKPVLATRILSDNIWKLSDKLPAAATLGLNGLASRDGLWVAVGDGGLVLTSPDYGETWTKRLVAGLVGENLTDAAFHNGLFIISSDKGSLHTSANGVTWVKRRAATGSALRDLLVTGSQVIALGDGGSAAVSFGGIDWLTIPGPTAQSTRAAAGNASTVVAVGTGGSIHSSSGTQPVRPTVSFATATSSFPENSGPVVAIVVNLSAVSLQPVKVLYSISGTATNAATGDYTVPTTALVFNPGEVQKNILLTIKPDNVDELQETVIIHLHSPSGDAALGTPSVHTYTIGADDSLPFFTQHPEDKLVALNGSTTFYAYVTGLPDPTLQWQKGTVNVPATNASATTTLLSLSGVKLTDAGTYKLVAKNTAGTTSSTPATLGVVDRTDVPVSAAADSNVTFTCNTGGTGFTFQWKRNGTPLENSTDTRISGTRTNKLTIKNVTLGDADIYRCTVSMNGLILDSGDFTLSITGGFGTVSPAPGANTVSGTWTLRNPLPENDDINAVVGNAQTVPSLAAAPKVVAVGNHGLILTSSDNGTTWTKVVPAPGFADDLHDIIWDSTSLTKRYIAVGQNSAVLTSTDGTTWTVQRALGTDTLRNIVKPNGSTYVVTGAQGTGASVQTTGSIGTTTTWVRGTPGTTEPIIDCCQLGSSALLAITPTKLLRASAPSFGGAATFTVITSPPSADFPTSLLFRNTSRVLLAARDPLGDTRVWNSSNGTAWSTSTFTVGPRIPEPYLSAGYADGSATDTVYVSGGNGTIYASTDGLTFPTLLSVGSPDTVRAVSLVGPAGSQVRVGVGRGARVFTLASSATAGPWTSRYSSGPLNDFTAVAVSGTAFTATGVGATLSSTDGLAWTATAQTATLRSLVHTGTQFIAAGQGIFTSTDGIALAAVHAASTPQRFNRVAHSSAYQLAVGSEAGTTLASLIFKSTDGGTTWTKITGLPTTANQALNGAAISGSRALVVGDAGLVLLSTNSGATWIKIAVPALTDHLTDAIFAANQFVFCTNKGAIWSGPNGTAFTRRHTGGAYTLNRLTQAQGQVFALGTAGTVLASFGGLAWSPQDAGSSQDLVDAAFNGTRMALVGKRGTVITSDSAASTRPTVAFASPTGQADESVTTAQTIGLTLTPAAKVPVTVLATVIGSATLGAAGDATLSATAVTFNPGETSKSLTLTLRNDTTDEPDETVILSLGQPTGDAALGTTSVHTFTIQDNDTRPVIDTEPVAQIVTLLPGGTPLTFTTAASGAPNPTALWKKGPAVVPALSGFNPSIPVAKLTDAGLYSLTATNTAGSVTSPAVPVTVVDNVPVGKVAPGDSTVTFTCPAAGTGLTFQWQRDGNDLANSTDVPAVGLPSAVRISGVTTATLTLKSVTVADSGVYRCRVTAGALSTYGGTTTLSVEVSVPRVLSTSLPSTYVGQPYTAQPTATGLPTSWDITQLPTGLTANTATGIITGGARQANATVGDNFSIRLVAKNIIGSSIPVLVPLHVNPMATKIAGGFNALLDRNAVNVNLGGYLTLLTTANGTFTGTLKQGEVSTPLMGNLTYDPATQIATASIPVAPVTPKATAARPGWKDLPQLPAATLAFTINAVTHTLVGTYGSLAFTATPTNFWSGISGGLPAARVGAYTFAIKPMVNNNEANDSPQGYGFGSFTIAADGTMTGAGVAADGTAFSTSSVLERRDVTTPVAETVHDFILYGGSYQTLGSIMGRIRCDQLGNNYTFPNSTTTPEFHVKGDLTWQRKPEVIANAAVEFPNAAARPYRRGFVNSAQQQITLTVAASGGRYHPPPAIGVTPIAPTTRVLMNLPDTVNNAQLAFLSGGLLNVNTRNAANNPDAILSIDAPATVVTSNTNNTLTKLTALDGATGNFSGNFQVTDADTVVGGNVVRANNTFRGIVIRRYNPANSSIAVYGFGHFLLPKLPAFGDGPGGGTTASTVTNSAMLSGRVTFTGNFGFGGALPTP